MQSMKLGIDVNRHKEIIVKAVSAILLLLLKHFKVRKTIYIALPYMNIEITIFIFFFRLIMSTNSSLCLNTWCLPIVSH